MTHNFTKLINNRCKASKCGGCDKVCLNNVFQISYHVYLPYQMCWIPLLNSRGWVISNTILASYKWTPYFSWLFFCSFLSRKGRFPTATITSFSSAIVLLRPWQSLLIVALMPTQLLHPTFILSALFFYWKCRVFV